MGTLKPTFDLLDAIPMGICLIDTSKRVVFMNRALEGLSGWDRSRVQGLKCFNILRQKACFGECPLDQQGEDLKEVCFESDTISFFRKRIPLRVTFSPILGERGEVVGYIECVEDLRHSIGKSAQWDRSYRFGNIIGKSPGMENIFRLLPLVADTDSPVLITGETGTGKDLLAEAIHVASPRSKGPFVKVNCGAVPDTLLESELFGHEKGAFTGAVEAKPGRFRLAHNGTLYLTEIGDLPLPLQVKLLTFLDDKVIYPLGGSKGFKANVRIIAATHRDLEGMAKEGRFRQDLLYRLNVLRLHLPPLRERGEDLKLLVDYFVKHLSLKARKGIKGLSNEAWDILRSYEFPGNVRELRNIIEYAVTICDGPTISPSHLPTYLLEGKREEPGAPQIVASQMLERVQGSNNWTEMEKVMILEALLKAKGKKSKAAELLGWGRSTLWRKMKEYGI